MRLTWPNQAASGERAGCASVHIGRAWRRVTEQRRSAPSHMAHSSPAKKLMWLHTMLRIVGAYVVLTSIGFAIWKTTGDDAGYQVVGLLVGFLVAGVVMLVGAIVGFCRRNWEAGLVALLFMAWALISAWSVMDRLARAIN